jgi:energy-coupling factor transporter ATP-binding protein EcfA2
VIKGVVLGDFKAFADQDIELKPITVFVGENNSGKSSVLAAIRLLAQTTQAPDPDVPLLFDGVFGDFGSFRDVVRGHHRGRPVRLGVRVPVRRIRKVGERDLGDASILSEFKYRPVRRDLYLRSSRVADEGGHLLTVARTADAERPSVVAVGRKTVPTSIRSQTSSQFVMQNFLPRLHGYADPVRSKSKEMLSLLETVEEYRAREVRAARGIATALAQVEVLGAMRQPPLRTYLNTGAVARRIGVAGENWGSLLALAAADRSSNLLTRIDRWVRRAGIAAGFDISWLSDRHFEILVQHPVSSEWTNIDDVGRGTSQVLPVLIGGYRLAGGSTYIVEEPEIHLHPRAQAELGSFFLDLHRRKVQTLIETHSEHLILRLQRYVAQGAIDPNDIVFYYVEATDEGKSIRKLTLDDSAAFRNGIPGGFFPQRMAEATELTRARSVRTTRD